MTQLRLTGSGEGDDDAFRDEERNKVYWPSERPHDVPPGAVQEYLEHDRWEEVEETSRRPSHRADGTTEDAGGAPGPRGDREDDVTFHGDDGDDGAEAEPVPASEVSNIDDTGRSAHPDGESGASDAGDGSDDPADDHDGDDGGYDPDVSESGSEDEVETQETTEDALGDGGEDGGEDGDEEDGDGDAEFDAGEYLDGDWRQIESAIKRGEVDAHLEELDEVERERGSRAREASILTAIEDRQKILSGQATETSGEAAADDQATVEGEDVDPAGDDSDGPPQE